VRFWRRCEVIIERADLEELSMPFDGGRVRKGFKVWALLEALYQPMQHSPGIGEPGDL
jgi:hypothetical protein